MIIFTIDTTKAVTPQDVTRWIEAMPDFLHTNKGNIVRMKYHIYISDLHLSALQESTKIPLKSYSFKDLLLMEQLLP